jgi:hypothetical protein
MAAILLPFTAMVAGEWQREIQIGAALPRDRAGLYLLINRRHPRFLARVRRRGWRCGRFWWRWRMARG